MEIYNEKLRDLFDNDTISTNSLTNSNSNISLNSSQKNNTKPLRIREHPNKGIYVQNLSQFNVVDLKNTMKYLLKGNQNRFFPVYLPIINLS